jgi:hypothetical protein
MEKPSELQRWEDVFSEIVGRKDYPLLKEGVVSIFQLTVMSLMSLYLELYGFCDA